MNYTQDKIIASKAAFAEFIASGPIAKRKLQSIAFHLRIDVDIGNATEDFLIVVISDELFRRGFVLANGYDLTGEWTSFEANEQLRREVVRLATIFNVHEEAFEFLLGFSNKSIRYKLKQAGIFGEVTLGKIFESAQSKKVIIGYLCDISENSADHIFNLLLKLKESMQELLSNWNAQIRWFENDRNKEKLRAASHFAAKQIPLDEGKLVVRSSEKINKVFLMPALYDIDDIEIFFHRQDLSPVLKIFIYEKIRGLYNKRSSRAEKAKTEKNCNFVLTPEAKKMIEQIAKDCGIKGRGSALLNMLFQAHNKQVLQNIAKGYAMVR